MSNVGGRMEVRCSPDYIEELDPEELKKIMDKDTTGEYLLLDVRQPDEYISGHIPGSRLIPLGELENRLDELDHDKKIITYCRSGHRSKGASILLCGLGYKDVNNLVGGILNWKYDLIKGVPDKLPHLITGKEEVGDILIRALSLEKGSLDFYSRAQERTNNLKTVLAFQKFETWEKKHMERLYNQYRDLVNDAPPLEKINEELNNNYMEGGVKIDQELTKLGETIFLDDLEALEIALEKEYLSYDFYKRTSGIMGSDKVKTLLHKLAGEEWKHINALLKQIEQEVKQ